MTLKLLLALTLSVETSKCVYIDNLTDKNSFSHLYL